MYDKPSTQIQERVYLIIIIFMVCCETGVKRVCHTHPDQNQSHKHSDYSEEQSGEEHNHTRAHISAEKHHRSYPATRVI